jgi:hypothetical protein
LHANILLAWRRRRCGGLDALHIRGA